MKFQTTTEYAIRLMVYMAGTKEETVSVNTLHSKLDIPYKYLGKLMHLLAEAKLLEVRRGKNGGYKIAGNLSDIYLYQIIGVVEGLENYERCVLGFAECSDEQPCSLHTVWLSNRENIKAMVFNTTLADLEKLHAFKH